MDAAHCVMGFFLSFVWSLSRYFVPSSAGRKRLNILGAVNAINQKILAIFNDTTINAEVLLDFLQQIHAQYADKPIYIVLDNARYQHCKTVKTFAQSLNIQLVFLPPYSPNLNIIERLWKWLKKKCLYAKYYPNFKDFSEAIQNTLKNANQNHQEELQKLLNLKFQTFR